MHKSALENAKLFFSVYNSYLSKKEGVELLDIGSQSINGSLRTVVPEQFNYIGVDFVDGENVDVKLDDPYKFPFETSSVDVVVSSSCFEHSDMFWLLFLEIMRVLKPDGLFYLNVPSNGLFHRYPIDCWRFYPDCGLALSRWGRRNFYDCTLLESYISPQNGGIWNDFVAVFLKDVSYKDKFLSKMIDVKINFTNGMDGENKSVINFQSTPEDQKKYKDKSNAKKNI
jgi:SAM-dependent methyltransferase